MIFNTKRRLLKILRYDSIPKVLKAIHLPHNYLRLSFHLNDNFYQLQNPNGSIVLVEKRDAVSVRETARETRWVIQS